MDKINPVHLVNILLILSPDARDCGCAGWTTAFVRDVYLPDQVTKTFHQQLITRRTISILPAANSTRKISGVDVVEPRLATNLTRTNQLLRSRVCVLCHAVVLVKGRDVPGNVG